MNSSDTRVATYLDDLARMLADLEPGDRDEVLAGIREHLDATLAEHPEDPAAVDAALLRLGAAEQVAAEAQARLPAPGRPVPVPLTAATVGHRARARIAGLCSLSLLGLPVVTALASGIASATAGALSDREPVGMFVAHPSEALILLPLLFLPWLVAVAVAVVGPDLSGRTTAILVLLGPATSFGVLITTLLGGPGLVVLGLVVAVLVGAGRQVWRETHP